MEGSARCPGAQVGCSVAFADHLGWCHMPPVPTTSQVPFSLQGHLEARGASIPILIQPLTSQRKAQPQEPQRHGLGIVSGDNCRKSKPVLAFIPAVGALPGTRCGTVGELESVALRASTWG